MTEYHKINTIFKRDPQTHRIIIGDYSSPEFEYLADNPWEFTEKVDGMNMRVIWEDGSSLSFRGRTDAATIHPALLQTMRDLFETRANDRVSVFANESCVLYGEGYGPGIQKSGGNYRADKGFVLFDVRVGRLWLSRENVVSIAAALGVDVVPVIGRGSLHDAVRVVADGFKSTWGDFTAEGLVVRPATELLDRRGHRIIAKIKHCDFGG